MKHDVTIYFVARYTFEGIEAHSHTEAMDKADALWIGHDLIAEGKAEDAEEALGYLVDDHDDEDYTRTLYYDADKKQTRLGSEMEKLARLRQLEAFVRLVAGMKKYGDYPDLDDMQSTINRLIEEARKLEKS